MTATLATRESFYAAAAGAAAALVGLVYVGVSIHVGRHPLDTRVRMLGTLACFLAVWPG